MLNLFCNYYYDDFDGIRAALTSCVSEMGLGAISAGEGQIFYRSNDGKKMLKLFSLEYSKTVLLNIEAY